MRLSKLYLFTLCVFLLAGAVTFCLRCWSGIHSPYELDYGEGAIMWQAQRVTHLAQAYHRLEAPPYMVFHYTPLYHLVTHAVNALTNDILAAGRWVSFVSALMLGVILGLFAFYAIPRRFPRFMRIGAAAVSGLLCFNLSTMKWAELMRVDLLALLLTFAGILLFVLAPRLGGLDYAAFLLFVLAFFTKQTQLAAPAACLIIALLVDRARAIRLFVFSALLTCLGFLALIVPTHGDALRHLFLYNQNPFSVLNMLGIVQLNVAGTAPLAALAFCLPIMSAVRMARVPLARRISVARWWLIHSQTRRAIAVSSIHMLFAFAVSFASGKRGSNYNYFLEWNLACCVPVALILVFLLRKQGTSQRVLAPELVVLTLMLIVTTNGVASLAERMRPARPLSFAQDTDRVTDFIRRLDGPVYSENMTILIQTGKEVFAEPSIITNLAQHGTWDQGDFVHRIQSQYFRAILVTTSLDNRNRYTVEVQAAIESAYRFDRSYGIYRIFIPR